MSPVDEGVIQTQNFQIYSNVMAAQQYQEVLYWCKDQIAMLKDELSIIDKLGDDWKNSIGPELLQLPENFDLAKIKAANHINVELTSRESALFFGLLQNMNIVLRYSNSSAGVLWHKLTGYSAESTRINLSYFESGAVPPKSTPQKELKHWTNIQEQLKAMLGYIAERVQASENIARAAEKAKKEKDDEDKRTNNSI